MRVDEGEKSSQEIELGGFEVDVDLDRVWFGVENGDCFHSDGVGMR